MANQMRFNAEQGGSVIVTQPPKDSAISPAGIGRDWNHSLTSCCSDAKVGMLGYFCPCCMSACVLNSMDECVYCACVLPEVSMIYSRAKIRSSMGIKGSLCGDVCCTLYCFRCVACQMYKELRDANQLNDSCCNCSCDRSKQAYCG